MLESRHTSPKAAIRFEGLEIRQMMSADIRTYDGTDNNLRNTVWGSVGQDLLRLAPSAYANGASEPAGADRASARVISDAVAAHGPADILNNRNMSAFVYAWGQFIDHDLDLTNTGTDEFDIAVPTGDPYFDINSTGDQVIQLQRSLYDPATGVTTPRQQTTTISSFIDGSMVYGSTPAVAATLRLGTGGLLKTSAGDLLPFNTFGLPMATGGGPDDSYFAAGDVRANENIELTAMQTLFMREHNRLATQIAKKNHKLTDEQIFQQARKIVIGEIESITYNEFLPALLGTNAVGAYRGYNSKVNPGITTEFSTAAFRLGHSMLQDDVEFMNNDGTAEQPEIPLAQAFFNPAEIEQTGIDPILKYLASSNAEEIDTKVVDGLRNFLFGQPGAGGFDLASLNIQRGRDHGLADYNTTRAALGLPRVTSFAQISSDPAVQAELESVYGNVNDIDLWVGGLAEDHVAGSSVGATFQRILVNQFTRTRAGDRLWYQRTLDAKDLAMVQSTSLADIISWNSDITNLQANVFKFDVEITGNIFRDTNGDGRSERGEIGVGGQTVTLLDAEDNVVATTQTSANGSYRFSNLELGSYHVAATLPTGFRFTTAQPVAIDATRGMIFSHVDFGEKAIAQSTPPRQLPPPPPMNPIAGGPVKHGPRMMDQVAV